MNTYYLSTECSCENEDGTPSNECFDCYDDDKSNLTYALEAWISNLGLSHIEIQGKGMGWTRASGHATIEAESKQILDALTLRGDYRLEFKLPADLDEHDFKVMRYSHDEPTGASFDISGLTTCDDPDCDGECNFNFCEGRPE